MTARRLGGEDLPPGSPWAGQIGEDMTAIDASSEWGLVGDIGATNARFALVRPDGSMGFTRAILCRDFPTVGEAITAFLAEAPDARPSNSVLAVACSPDGDVVSLTNHTWSFSTEALRRSLGLARLKIVNDFHANALAVPHLGPDELIKIGGGEAVEGAPLGIVGPGSGLGVSVLVPSASGPIALPGEGGHVTMAPADQRESAVLDLLRQRFGHVSAERVLSGPGLVNLYNVLRELVGAPATPLSAEEISDPDMRTRDPFAGEATEMFCAMLGTVAGNLALTLGARGGIYIAGGIVPKLGRAFTQSAFRERFEAKGRFASYVGAVPTYIVARPFAALLGAAALLRAG